MIEIKNLCKSYGGLKVYENFNLKIDGGGVTCILGESGCGKTTLLNCIAGITPYEGSITKSKCSYIFQSPVLVPNLTVFENLSLACKNHDEIFAMLERVKLSDKALEYPLTLSGGQARRVAIARAFLYGGDALLADEPFSSLDLKLKTQMIELFFDMRRGDRRCAVVVTHDADEAVSIADKIIVLEGGMAKLDMTVPGKPPRPYGSCEDIRKTLISALIN